MIEFQQSAVRPALSAHDVDEAAARIADVVSTTPLEFSERLSEATGARVYLKREDLQRVRSYKLRGAYNLMVQLTDAERAVGVVAASAGNHAQGVAFSCSKLGVRGRIYVPTTTPKQKRDRIAFHGGDFVEVISTGVTYDAAARAARDDVERTGATIVPPFDDARTAAGQGTIGREILAQLDCVPDVVVLPVGGGGCLTGVATYLSERSPSTSILGVEPSGAASMTAALVAGGPVTLADVDPFVDGASVKRVGDIPYSMVSSLGARVAAHSSPIEFEPTGDDTRGAFVIGQIDEGAICTAMLELYQNDGIIAEPAGALSVAALEHTRLRAGDVVVCLVSGGNNDVSRYGEVLERSLVHRGVKHYFLVDFPQEPGSLRFFLNDVLGPADDVTLFEYVKRNNRETGAALVGIELGARLGLSALLERMEASPMNVEHLEPGTPAYRYLT